MLNIASEVAHDNWNNVKTTYMIHRLESQIDVRLASSLTQHIHIASLGHIDVRFANSLKQQLHIASFGHIDVHINMTE
jgi:hypothetical protein